MERLVRIQHTFYSFHIWECPSYFSAQATLASIKCTISDVLNNILLPSIYLYSFLCSFSLPTRQSPQKGSKMEKYLKATGQY